MARYYLRGSGGRFAGSSGGSGGSRGGGSHGGRGLPAGVKRGGPLTKATGAGGGYQRGGKGIGRRGITGKKIYTRGEVYSGPGGTRIGARRYVASGRRSSRDALVMKVRNGRVTSEPPKRGIVVRGAVSGGTRSRPGSPIGGNKNVRYVSRTTAVTRRIPGTYLKVEPRGVGRYFSHRGATKINTGRSDQVKRGYIVMYGGRQKVA